MSEALKTALALLVNLDAKLVEIVLLSLSVSLSAVVVAALLGLPLGAAIAVGRFPGRQVVIVALNALMGLPPVVVGLVVYLLLSRAGPLGPLGILFTPSAMIVAQTILILPIIAALSRQAIEDAWSEYEEQLRSLGARRMNAALTLLWDTRFSLLTAILAGFEESVSSAKSTPAVSRSHGQAVPVDSGRPSDSRLATDARNSRAESAHSARALSSPRPWAGWCWARKSPANSASASSS